MTDRQRFVIAPVDRDALEKGLASLPFSLSIFWESPSYASLTALRALRVRGTWDADELIERIASGVLLETRTRAEVIDARARSNADVTE